MQEMRLISESTDARERGVDGMLQCVNFTLLFPIVRKFEAVMISLRVTFDSFHAAPPLQQHPLPHLLFAVTNGKENSISEYTSRNTGFPLRPSQFKLCQGVSLGIIQMIVRKLKICDLSPIKHTIVLPRPSEETLLLMDPVCQQTSEQEVEEEGLGKSFVWRYSDYLHYV